MFHKWLESIIEVDASFLIEISSQHSAFHWSNYQYFQRRRIRSPFLTCKCKNLIQVLYPTQTERAAAEEVENLIMSGEQEEEGQAKRQNIDERILKKLDQLIGVAKKAEVNDKEIFKKALDDLVNVNSLFTIAVFVGLSVASRNQYSLENRRECDAGPEVAKRLVVFEVISFACFLLSSLIAKSLKVFLNLFRPHKFEGHRFFGWARGVAFLSSVIASTTGIVLLTLSMADVVQIKVGKLSCGSYYTVTAVATLSVIVFIGVLIYLPSMLFTIFYIMFRIPNQGSSNDKGSQSLVKEFQV